MNEPTKNPYKLIWYKSGWSESKTDQNNALYWAWEIIYNGLVPANSAPDYKERFIATNPTLPALLKSHANR